MSYYYGNYYGRLGYGLGGFGGLGYGYGSIYGLGGCGYGCGYFLCVDIFDDLVKLRKDLDDVSHWFKLETGLFKAKHKTDS
ncbi:keratin-associated protein 19-9b-like [Ursus maritimus]|uniref:Keratin-associated protein 19-9b-like n=1 Tax=Ursus maritimus TaxID=29073 RepID=A0A8M1F2D4_URSMA|nr:keratin-associated protein 19-9b-like [Ursus maritimus]